MLESAIQILTQIEFQYQWFVPEVITYNAAFGWKTKAVHSLIHLSFQDFKAADFVGIWKAHNLVKIIKTDYDYYNYQDAEISCQCLFRLYPISNFELISKNSWLISQQKIGK